MKSKIYYFSGLQLVALSIPFLVFYAIILTIGLSDPQAVALIQHPLFWGPSLTLILGLPTATMLYYAKQKRLSALEYLTISFLRYFVAFLMFYYGAAKLHSKFFDIAYLTQDSRVIDVDYFKLTWFYYGKSNVQEALFGLFEFVPAILLLFRRTWFLGAVLLFPVAANVLLTNLFNGVSGITYFVSWIITLDTIYLLFSRKTEILHFFKSASAGRVPLNKIEHIFRLIFKWGILLVIASYAILVAYSKLNTSRKPDLVNYNKHTGAYELLSLELNGNRVVPQEGDSFYKTIYLETQARWNSVRSFSKAYHPIDLIVRWNANNDSVITFLKTKNYVESIEIDSLSRFQGTYVFKDSLLFVNGLQKRDTLKAIYRNKNLKDFNWFW